MGTGEPGQRVEKNDDIASHLDQTPRPLENDTRHRHVLPRHVVGRRGDHLAADVALHVGHFLGTLVDQEDDQVNLGMIVGDRSGDLLQQRRLAGARRRDDQAALPLADRGQEIDDPRRQLRRLGLQPDSLERVDGRQLREEPPFRELLLGHAIDRSHLDQGGGAGRRTTAVRRSSATGVVAVGPVARVTAVVRRCCGRSAAMAGGRRETFDLAPFDPAAVEPLVDRSQAQKDLAGDEDVLRRGSIVAPGLPQIPSPFTQNLEDAARLDRGLRGVLDRRARV